MKEERIDTARHQLCEGMLNLYFVFCGVLGAKSVFNAKLIVFRAANFAPIYK